MIIYLFASALVFGILGFAWDWRDGNGAIKLLFCFLAVWGLFFAISCLKGWL